jgi:hypothetical protein
MKLEVIVIAVSDVGRAQEFHRRLGWRFDAEFTAGDDLRLMQFTPPGSGASVIFGKYAAYRVAEQSGAPLPS